MYFIQGDQKRRKQSRHLIIYIEALKYVTWKVIRYTFVSMGNWLILVILDLLWNSRSPKKVYYGKIGQPDTNRATWFDMTQFWGQRWSNEVVLVEKWKIWPKRIILKQLWTSNSLFSLIMLFRTPYYWLSQSCGTIGTFRRALGVSNKSIEVL